MSREEDDKPVVSQPSPTPREPRTDSEFILDKHSDLL